MSLRDELKAAEDRFKDNPRKPPQTFAPTPAAIECPSCGEKSLGLSSLTKAIVSGQARQDTQLSRWRACAACQEVNPAGERLFRKIKEGAHYCGVPRLNDLKEAVLTLSPAKALRDEAAEGCGCNLSQKIGFRASACPRGHWGAETEKP